MDKLDRIRDCSVADIIDCHSHAMILIDNFYHRFCLYAQNIEDLKRKAKRSGAD